MKEIRITVLKKVEHIDLMEEYENPMVNACALTVGDVFISQEATKPVNLCDSAWVSLYPYVFSLANGAMQLHNHWLKKDATAIVSCNDGIRPVSFLLEVNDGSHRCAHENEIK